MNLMEVIKSGKKFRRKSWDDAKFISGDDIADYAKEGILADDWELETTVELTLYEFSKAWVDALNSIDLTTATYSDLYIRVARSLGFLK